MSPPRPTTSISTCQLQFLTVRTLPRGALIPEFGVHPRSHHRREILHQRREERDPDAREDCDSTTSLWRRSSSKIASSWNGTPSSGRSLSRRSIQHGRDLVKEYHCYVLYTGKFPSRLNAKAPGLSIKENPGMPLLRRLGPSWTRCS